MVELLLDSRLDFISRHEFMADCESSKDTVRPGDCCKVTDNRFQCKVSSKKGRKHKTTVKISICENVKKIFKFKNSRKNEKGVIPLKQR